MKKYDSKCQTIAISVTKEPLKCHNLRQNVLLDICLGGRLKQNYGENGATVERRRRCVIAFIVVIVARSSVHAK